MPAATKNILLHRHKKLGEETAPQMFLGARNTTGNEKILLYSTTKKSKADQWPLVGKSVRTLLSGEAGWPLMSVT